eukprot:CAMPEP_0206039500 /NCGR_PEP_ID=MMETSP1466-20131121/4793_1 /ASSEMBLY_ACC=CAM_ASM_001126 /TAXON_ID=44452 /ORGANISM="Pavlova gyrans, Strain CCMP608" /LENGTH=69 /DNA_ID=CAMNT_0053414139 /DNA_START=156 /DNA_END=365 /DNA_ORIENTATION=+
MCGRGCNEPDDPTSLITGSGRMLIDDSDSMKSITAKVHGSVALRNPTCDLPPQHDKLKHTVGENDREGR